MKLSDYNVITNMKALLNIHLIVLNIIQSFENFTQYEIDKFNDLKIFNPVVLVNMYEKMVIIITLFRFLNCIDLKGIIKPFMKPYL